VSLLWLLHTKLLPFLGGHADSCHIGLQVYLFHRPGLGLWWDIRPYSVCQIGVLETGKTTKVYNYVPQAGGAGRGQGAGLRDPLAYLCDDLPGLKTGDITALLRDLPIPIAGDAPEMMVEEAIEV
jgi:hypothetical protein